MIYNERTERESHVLNIARQLMTAARTAPKAKGVDSIEAVTITGEDIRSLANAMRVEAEERGFGFFVRDAGNIEQAEAVVLIGVKDAVQSLNCGYCGYPTCAEKLSNPMATCTVTQADLGIAVGSAAATASDLRVDTRVLFSAGIVALNQGLLEGCRVAYAIPISVKAKNPFFDRK
ncbi:MAG: DUF2148 domain-containing protein [Rikenellaceae bacterium]